MVTVSSAGAGKTIIWYDNLSKVRVHELMLLASSAIIEDIRTLQRIGMASLAFFYCDFRDDEKKDFRGLLSSLLVQLGGQSDAYSTVLSNLYVTYGRGLQHASDGELVSCLKDMLSLPWQPAVHIVIDALDECPVTTGSVFTRKKVLEFVEELVELQIPNLRICVTSRPEADIIDVLQNLAFCSVSLHGESGQVLDISEYVKSFVHTSRDMRRWKATDKQLVIDELINKADGMYVIRDTIPYFSRLRLKCRFRWVACQLVYLSRCIPGRVRHALKELPTTLDATYARSLEAIDEQNWEYARRLFHCVAVASRPLRAKELAEFLAFDFQAESTPKFLADWRSEDPENVVLSICSTLLVVVKPPSGSPIIQFSHFSVKEYLTSARLAETNDTISRFHVSPTPAHTIVAQACLSVLLHIDENITKDSLNNFPLAEYAAEHWVDHARIENVSPKVQGGMKVMFDPGKSHLSVWVWISNPDPWCRFEPSERPEEPRATPLHYAAVCNMHDIASFLIAEHSQDVNAWGFDGETPLHVSSRLGHVEISRILLKHGANTEVQDTDFYTPLERVALEGHVEIAQALLEHGAKVNELDSAGYTPLYLASEAGQLAVAQVLLSHGADVTAKCKKNQTALHRAEEEEVARLLLEHGADANALDIKNRTPLHRVSKSGGVGGARVLLKHGVDVNARDANNATSLHLASDPKYEFRVRRCLEVARLLLQCGSDVHARDDEGRTPFMRAAAEGRHEIMQLLLEYGAKDHRVWMATDGKSDVV
jgi:ankyrin repeat protein